MSFPILVITKRPNPAFTLLHIPRLKRIRFGLSTAPSPQRSNITTRSTRPERIQQRAHRTNSVQQHTDVRQKMHLVFDFDGTITEKDTIGELAASAITFQKRRIGQNLDNTWAKVVQNYLDDSNAHKETYTPVEEDRTSASQELQFLASMRPIEEASLARVEASGVFNGVDEQTQFDMGVRAVESGSVTLRAGFAALVQLAHDKGWHTSIVSVNWSRAFIEGVLHPRLTMSVTANEILPDGKIRGPHHLGHQLTSAADKIRVLEDMSPAAKGDSMMYFGDSTTDLACLLRIGGVAIARDDVASSLVRTLRRVGVAVPRAGHRQQADGGEATVVWASDFDELLVNGDFMGED